MQYFFVKYRGKEDCTCITDRKEKVWPDGDFLILKFRLQLSKALFVD
jgi:hypothetical protein